MQDLKPQRAVKSDSSWHLVGAQCDGADPLDHGQSSPVLFPRAESVAAPPVSLFSVKHLRFSVGRSCKLAISRASALYLPRGSSGRYWLCRTRGRLDIELLGRRTDRALAHLDQRTNCDRAARSRDCFAVYGAFCITMFARPSFGGSLYDQNGYLSFKPPLVQRSGVGTSM